MESQKKPFLYTLCRSGEKNQDLSFKRIWGNPEEQPNVWGMHLDIEDPTPAKVLIFVNGGTDPREIMHEINQAQTFFRKQTEPPFS